jgi:hypothetical protein
MTEGTSKEWNEIISGLKKLVTERNKKFGIEDLTKQSDSEKAKKSNLKRKHK